jgi:hypothetical protein
MYMFRRDDWPMVHDIVTGAITPIDLPDTAEIAEPTYFAFCPRNVLAVLYNHAGPKVSHLERYLAEFYDDMEVRFAPIVAPDVLRTIRDAGEIRSIELTIPTAQAEALPDGDPVLREMRALANQSPAQKVSLRLSVDGRSPDWGTRDSFTSWGKEVVRSIGRRLESFDRAVVTVAPSDSRDDPALNLLHEEIVMTEEVTMVHGLKWIEPDAAADALRDAYRRARPIIEEVMGG